MSATTLLWLITGALMLQPLSTDLYLASLPHLAIYFEVTPAAIQQTLSLFVIGFGTAQLISGPLSDRFGRRPVMLAGLAVYVAGSLACAAAPVLPALLSARFVQAIGCCTAVVVARAIIRDAFDMAEGARFIARAYSLLSITPLLGPIAGGYLQIAFGWRAAFFAHALFGVALAAASLRWLEESNHERNPEATRIAELRRSYAGVACTPAFWAYTLPGSLSFASIFVFISGSSFVLIRVLGVPTEYYGYCFAFGVLGYLAGTLICRRLLARIGIERTLGVGTSISLGAGMAFAGLAIVGAHHWTVVLGSQFLTMLGHGINFPCAQSGAVAPFPRQAGAAAGLLGFSIMMAALLAGTWVGFSHDGTLYPLAFTSAAVGASVFASARALARYRAVASA